MSRKIFYRLSISRLTSIVFLMRRAQLRALIGGLILVLLLTASGPASAADTTASAEALAGLWKAKNRFGPDGRGPLIIQKNGAAYIADMLGRKVAVRLDKNELTFDLPADQGTFRGRFEAKSIVGHWTKPGTPSNFSKSASLVVLKPDGANRWRGEVRPLQDEFTFYLLAQKRPDDSLGVVLRNPQRDYGTQLGTEQRLVREGDVVKLIGKPRGKQEESEIASGTYDANAEVFTLDFPGRGKSYDFRRDGDDSEFYPRGKNPGRYTYSSPPALDDDWSTSTLEAAQIDPAGIEQAIQTVLDMPMDSAAAPQVHSLLMARHGKLVLEEYFHGYHRDKLHITRSASKSMTSIVVGAAMQAGAPLKLSTPVYQLMNGGTFPEGLEPGKRAMTLDNLLNMASGLFCDDNNLDAPGNEVGMLDQTEEPDYYRFYMKVPLDKDRVPGGKALYCSGDPNLALGMVGRAMGENPMYTFDRLVGGPMKITRYDWQLDPAGNPYGGGSTGYLPRDFIKFGQLMLNKGTWNGRRILSEDYVARSSVAGYGINTEKDYAYLWWQRDYPYQDRTVHAFYASGRGGQFVVVIPDLDLVIATYNGNFNSRGSGYVLVELIPKHILPAVREASDARTRR